MSDTLQNILKAGEKGLYKGVFIDGVASVIQKTLNFDYVTTSEADFIKPYITNFISTSYTEGLSYFIREISSSYGFYVLGGIIGGIASSIQFTKARPYISYDKVSLISMAVGIYNAVGYELIKKFGFEEDLCKESFLIMVLEISTSVIKEFSETMELANPAVLLGGFINGLSIVISSISPYGLIMDALQGNIELASHQDQHNNATLAGNNDLPLANENSDTLTLIMPSLSGIDDLNLYVYGTSIAY